MSRNRDAAGPNPPRKHDRARGQARRHSPGRLFRPAAVDGAAGAVVERLEDRTLLAIGVVNPILIASATHTFATVPVAQTTVNVPVTTPATAKGPAGETVIVTVTVDTAALVNDFPDPTFGVSVKDSTTNASYHLDAYSINVAGTLAVLTFSEYLQQSLAAGATPTQIAVTVPATTKDVAVDAVAAEGLQVIPDPGATNSSSTSTADLKMANHGAGAAGTTPTSVATGTGATQAFQTPDELAIGVVGVEDSVATIAGDATFSPETGLAVGSATGLASSTEYKDLLNVSTPQSFAPSFTAAAADDWVSSIVTYVAQIPVAFDQPVTSNPTNAPYAVNVGSTLMIPLNRGLGYDSVVYGGGTPTYASVALPSHATTGGFTLVASTGGFTYTPANTNSTTTPDSFTYQIKDGDLTSVTQAARITVTNDAPAVSPAGTPASPIVVRADGESGAVTINQAAGDGGTANFYQVSLLPSGTLSFTAGGPTLVPVGTNTHIYLTPAQAAAGVFFTPATGLFSGDAGNDQFGFSVAAATTESDTDTLGVGTSRAVVFNVEAPHPPVVSPNISVRENPAATTQSTSLTVTRSTTSPTDVGYVNYFKVTNLVHGTLVGSDSVTYSDGDFIPFAVAAGGLTFTPAAGYSNTSAAELFDVAGATTNVPATAIVGAPSPVDISVEAPQQPTSSSSPSGTVDENTAATATSVAVTLTIANTPLADLGYVHYFKITSAISGGVLSDASHPIAGGGYQMGDFVAIATGQSSATLTFTPTINTTGPAANFGFSFAAATTNGASAAVGPQNTFGITVFPVSDIGVIVATPSGPIAVSTPFTFTDTITNHGPSTATGVTLLDTLPSTVTYDSATVSVGGASPTPLSTSSGSNPYSFAIGSLLSGQSAVVVITVTPTMMGSSLVNMASASHDANEHEPATDPDPNSASTSAVLVANGLIVTSTSPDPSVAGSLPFIINELTNFTTLPALPNGEAETITFQVSPPTITLAAPLAPITRKVFITGGPTNLSPTITVADAFTTGIGQPIFKFGPGSDGSVIQSLIVKTTEAGSAIDLNGGAGLQVLNDSLGGAAKAGVGLLVDGNATASLVSGNTITGFAQGILVGGTSTLASIVANTISGNVDGLDVTSSGNTVGGPSSGQLNDFYANSGNGILISGTTATGNVVQGNLIGTLGLNITDPNGNGVGIKVDAGAVGNVIGAPDSLGPPANDTEPSVDYSTVVAEGNQVAHNAVDGVVVTATAGRGNTIRGNSIFLNGLGATTGQPVTNDGLSGQGIEQLRATANAPPVPTILGASFFENTLTIQGNVTNPGPDTGLTYRLDFYTQSVSNPRDNSNQPTATNLLNPAPQGKVYLGSLVYNPGTGKPFSYVLTYNPALTSLVQDDQFVTATATILTDTSSSPQQSLHDTSRFSAPTIISNGLQVTNNADNGDNNAPTAGSLRAAIFNANLLAGNGISSVIVFSLPAGELTITPTVNPLPTIVAGYTPASTVQTPNPAFVPVPVTIDGYTQGLSRARAISGGLEQKAIINVVLDGSMLPAGASAGLTVGDGPVAISGLDFVNFKAGTPAVLVAGGVDSQVSGDQFGSSTGTSPDAGDGIEVLPSAGGSVTGLLIGGPNVADRNIIDGNLGAGIEVQGLAGTTISGLTIQGNFIGLEADGRTPFADGNGIVFDGAGTIMPSTGATFGALITGNAISGNTSDGVSVSGASNVVVSGNVIGSNLVATTVGGLAAAGSLEIGNGVDGVLIEGDGDQVTNNLIDERSAHPPTMPTTYGTNGIEVDDAQSTRAAGNTITGAAGAGILVDGGASSTALASNSITGTSGGPGDGDGIEVLGATTASTSITGGSIAGTKGDGIAVSLAATTTISGITIGAAGGRGISLINAPGTSIGGTTASTIGGSALDGIDVSGGSGITIADISIQSSGGNGISLTNTQGTSIGGTTTGAAVTIGGTSTGAAVSIVGGSGASITGLSITGGGGDGISLANAQGITIGGTASGAAVTISSVSGDGISVGGGSGNSIEGATIGAGGDGIALTNTQNTTIDADFIGVNALGAITGLHGDGISVANSPMTYIGTDANGTVAGNTIGLAVKDGILVANLPASPAGVTIANNFIGTNAAGANGLGNDGDGIMIADAPSTQVSNNVIADNLRSGIEATSTSATMTSPTPISLVIRQNHIGTDLFGSQALPNRGGGMTITGNDLAGDNVQVVGNTISGNSANGVSVVAVRGLTLGGNLIGTNNNGTSALANLGAGVSITGSDNAQVLSNVIAGNSGAGLYVTGSPGITIKGNHVGVGNDSNTSDGAIPLGNGYGSNAPSGMDGGIEVGPATGAGATITGNVISSNGPTSGNSAGGYGLLIADSDATGTTISNNEVGTDAVGVLARGNHGVGIMIGNVPGVTVQGNIVAANAGDGLQVSSASGPQVVNNTIGAGTNGVGSFGNVGAGVHLVDTTKAVLTGNVVVNNQGAGGGVFIDDPAGHVSGDRVSGNYVGTNANSAIGLGNSNAGIEVSNGLNVSITGNTVGSNGVAGILDIMGSNATIQGNFVGTNSSSAGNLGNVGDGIRVTDAAGVSITGNTIGANSSNGIGAEDLSNALVQHNYVGTDQRGASIGNQADGIKVVGDASSLNPATSTNSANLTVSANVVVNSGQYGIQVGGVVNGMIVASNTIGGSPSVANKEDGVLIGARTSANHPQASYVSVALTSNTIVGNGQDGLHLVGAQNVHVGQPGTGGDNIIDGNLGNGIGIGIGSTLNTLDGNQVDGNQANGIEVAGASNNSLQGPDVEGNSSDGIHVDTGSSNNTIRGGTVLKNTGNGITIDQSSGNSVLSSTIAGNHNSGVLLSTNSSGNLLQSDTIGGVSGPANFGDGVSIIGAGPGNTIDSDTIDDNDNNGISISSTATGQFITHDYIGTDRLGSANVGNRNYGVFINNSEGTQVGITATLQPAGNEIFDNGSQGVVISGGTGGNRVLNNFIEANQLSGVLLDNTTGQTIGAIGSPNTIYLNKTDGVGIFGGSGNTVAGDIIGTNSAGDYPGNAPFLGNLGDGVHIVGSSGNKILSDVISASNQSGVEIFGNSSGNTVSGDVLGTTSSNSLLGNKLDGVLISGSVATSSMASTNPVNNVIAGNDISGNQADGVAINLAGPNVVQGNQVGTSPAGSLANKLDGVNVSYSTGVIIQGGNVIAGNAADGVRLVQSQAVAVDGNTLLANAVDGIGLDDSSGATIDGNTARSNLADGIRVYDGSTQDAIGVPRAGVAVAGNTLIGNGGAGVEISTLAAYNVVENNDIGFIAGNSILGNAIGVFLNQVDNNFIGGASLAAGANTITGNKVYGLEIFGNSPTPSGDVVQGNYIGTDPAGNSPGAFPVGSSDVGVFVLNSQDDKIGGNLISGNHLAGVELAGGQSMNDVVGGNSVGPDASLKGPIVFPGHGRLDYAALFPTTPGYVPTRQTYGIVINGTAPDNSILGNNVLANQVGIDVQGGVAGNNSAKTDNVIQGNHVGDLNYVHGGANLTGLGNFDGIYVDNTSSTSIVGNILAGNISIGVGLVGPSAGNNVVQRNIIAGTGGYSDPSDFVNGKLTLVSLIGYPVALQDTQARNNSVPIFGTGIYVESGSGNVIGSNPNGKESQADGNTILDNNQVGIYVFNDGRSLSNDVRSNSVQGANYGAPARAWDGDYGILLFNSSGDLINPSLPNGTGVKLVGSFANTFGNGGTNRIANFREYTGPASIEPGTFSLPSNVAPTGTSSVTKASIVTRPVQTATVGKSHPLPPASKAPARKR